MSKARDLANAGTALTTVSATELGYLDGVTSAVQTQLNAKQAVVSGVDNTEIGYLDGVTSAIQTQINSKIGQSTAINPAIVDAKGDLIAATAADTVSRLAVGTNDQVLTADSTAATGMAWKTSASGGMTLLSTTTLSGTSTTISGISGSYTNLQVVIYGVNMSAESQLRITPSQGTNIMYYSRFTTSDSVTAIVGNYLFLNAVGASLASGRTDNIFTINIENYASSFRKSFSGSGGGYSSSIVDIFPAVYGGAINTTSAISSLIISNSASATFNAGTVLIYGVK